MASLRMALKLSMQEAQGEDNNPTPKEKTKKGKKASSAQNTPTSKGSRKRSFSDTGSKPRVGRPPKEKKEEQEDPWSMANAELTNKESAPSTTKKKKKGRLENSNWVQCDRCQKWRLLPIYINMDMLGEGDWFCEMNTYDVRRNFCGAKEQSAEEVRKEREQARRDAEPKSPKRTKNTTNNRATSDPNPPYQNTPSTTPRPLPGALGTGEDVMKDTELVVAGLNRSVSAPGTLEQSPTNGANGKTPNPPQSTTSPTTAPTTAPKPAAPVEDMEWVQCEKCEKWRRLPPNLSAADLPDTWYCSMNTWDKSTATCAAKENEADNNVKGEYTILSGASAAAGKLSYRNLMFGTQGMNGGRPFSEKARAMDSVFTRVNGVGEAEAGYKGSSMFQSGGQKGAGAGNKIEAKPVFLKMFSKTRICKDLYNGVQVEPPPAAPLPKSEKEEKDPEDDSNPTISPTFKSLVFQSLSNKALAPYHCLLELQLRSYTHDGPTDSIRTRATVSSVEDALESLLREGLVEKVEGRMAGERLADSATLRYRAIREVSEKLARSKMLKVRKPWRHESDRNTTSNEEEQEEREYFGCASTSAARVLRLR
ncbi:hypothetical protein TL16_g12967 [Triparma laevis f. inornata]|uniref:CW-type domain-containing protein n=1 Tax=Triparma laevis f. inornata TaxID=1714386 RepID=A0A9W7BUG0_9STRA|nr:hypothetical protein TL16_g12967 [Triparma laevis f. inornata]